MPIIIPSGNQFYSKSSKILKNEISAIQIIPNNLSRKDNLNETNSIAFTPDGTEIIEEYNDTFEIQISDEVTGLFGEIGKGNAYYKITYKGDYEGYSEYSINRKPENKYIKLAELYFDKAFSEANVCAATRLTESGEIYFAQNTQYNLDAYNGTVSFSFNGETPLWVPTISDYVISFNGNNIRIDGKVKYPSSTDEGKDIYREAFTFNTTRKLNDIKVISQYEDSYNFKVKTPEKIELIFIYSKYDGSYSNGVNNGFKIEIELTNKQLKVYKVFSELTFLDKEVITIGTLENDKNILEISENDFIQSSDGELSSNIYINFEETLNQYIKGKETLNLRCSIGEYYDDEGNKVISTQTSDKMAFNLYDEVLPLYKHPCGTDMPISINENGYAKVFTVLGSKVFFDGAVWQEISTQENSVSFKIFNDGADGIEYSFDPKYMSFSCIGYSSASPQIENFKIASTVNGLPVTKIEQISYWDEYGNLGTIDAELIEVPDTVTEISDYAFGNFIFANIIVGKNVEKVGAYCLPDKTVFYKGNQEEWENIELAEENDYSSLYFYSEIEPKIAGTYWHYDTNGNVAIWFSEATVGLAYTLSADGKYYICSGIGTATDTDIVISPMYNGLIVKQILASAFRNNTNITSVSFTAGVEDIRPNAFRDCTNLEFVTIGDSIKYVRNLVFIGCTNIKSIYIGANVEIFENSLSNCINLKTIKVNSRNNTFMSLDDNLYSKDGKTLIQYACGKTNSEFNIPDGVITIGTSAFSSCESLTNITLPDSVTTIGNNAFLGCTGLMSVTIGNNVTTIGGFAFYGCASLKSIIIPNSVTIIDSQMFFRCYSLTNVVIGDSITTIENSAFSECNSLQKVYYVGTEIEWGNINIKSGNSELTNATIYYYTETKPTESGNYWHYDDNGNPIVWE